jgi:hypothetical protein
MKEAARNGRTRSFAMKKPHALKLAATAFAMLAVGAC